MKVLKTDVSTDTLGTRRFEKLSSWKRLVTAITRFRHIASSFHKDSICHSWHACKESVSVETFEDSANFILKDVQHEVYSKEIELLKENTFVPRNSSICSLNPFIGPDGL